MSPTMPEHSRPLTTSQSAVWHTLADQHLNDGWLDFPDLLAVLVERDAYDGLDLAEAGDVTRVLFALADLGLVVRARDSWRAITVENPAPTQSRKRDRDRDRLRELNKKDTKPMKFNRSKPTPKPVPMGAAAIEAERQRLKERFHGPGAVAREAVADEPILADRLERALADGLEVALVEIPRFRRAAVVEEALDAWEKARKDGPCQRCGCAVPRRGRELVRYVPGAAEDGEYPWSSYRGETVCAWCADVLREHGDTGLRGIVFKAAGSITTNALTEVWDLSPWAPWWSELKPEKQAQARKAGKGAPWAHIDIDAARALAADLLMKPGGQGPSGFARTAAAIEHVSIPGLRARPWTPDDSLVSTDRPERVWTVVTRHRTWDPRTKTLTPPVPTEAETASR